MRHPKDDREDVKRPRCGFCMKEKRMWIVWEYLDITLCRNCLKRAIQNLL